MDQVSFSAHQRPDKPNESVAQVKAKKVANASKYEDKAFLDEPKMSPKCVRHTKAEVVVESAEVAQNKQISIDLMSTFCLVSETSIRNKMDRIHQIERKRERESQ